MSTQHICSPTGTCHGSWNSRVVYLVWPLLASQPGFPVLDSAISNGFLHASVGFRQLIHTSHAHAEILYANILMAETTVKRRALSLSCSKCKIYVGAIFRANMRQNVITPRARILPDCDHLVEKLALLQLRLFPGAFQNMQWCVVEE